VVYMTLAVIALKITAGETAASSAPWPWKAVEQLNLETLSWVRWQNTELLRGWLSRGPQAAI